MNNLWTEVHMEDSCVDVSLQKNCASDIVSLHSHNFYEILFFITGEIDYLIEENRFRIQQGDVVLIPPGKSHRPLFPDRLAQPCERIVLWISAEYWKSITQQNPNANFAFEQCEKKGVYLLRSGRATWMGLYAGFTSILNEAEQKQFNAQLCIRMNAIVLLAHIGRTYYYQDIVESIAEKDTLFDNVFNYINTNIADPISLESVSKRFLVSKSTISHMFQKKMGVSFYHCVIQRRLISAKNKFLSGAYLKDVWESSGFSDYSGFYRSFKKEYGMSPSEFQAQNRVDSP